MSRRPASVRMRQLAASACIAALLAACAGPASQGPARLRVAALIERAARVRLALCPTDGGACAHQTLERNALGPTLALAPGRYRVTVTIDGRARSYFQLGLGADEDYGLALYGADLPGASPPGTWPAIQRALGGSDARRVAGFRINHRLLTLHRAAPGDPAILQLAHFAPGRTAIAATVQVGTTSIDMPAVRYGAVGDAVNVPHPDAVLRLRWPDREAPLARQALRLPLGSRSVVYVAGFDAASRPRLLVDTRPVRHVARRGGSAQSQLATTRASDERDGRSSAGLPQPRSLR